MPVMTGEAAIVVNAAQADDRLAALFDAHHPRLYRLARRMSRDQETARDLVQDTFLRAARRVGSIPQGAEREEAWLVRVLVNLCRDRWRQGANRRRLDAEGHGLPGAGAADAERALVAKSVVWHALDELRPRRRAVLVMHELEGLSVAVIARVLGVTQTTVRWHLSIGRRQLEAIIRGSRDCP